jgi:hypothetical protein
MACESRPLIALGGRWGGAGLLWCPSTELTLLSASVTGGELPPSDGDVVAWPQQLPETS